MEEIIYMENEQYILGKLPIEQAEAARISWNMAERNRIEGMIPFEYYYLNDMVCFKYDMTFFQPITIYFEKKEADFLSIYFFYQEIFQILERGMAYLLEEKEYLLKPEWIFWNPAEKKIVLCYMPGREKEERREILQLTEYFMQHISHTDKKAVDFIYGIYEFIFENEPAIEEILEWIEKERTEIPEVDEKGGNFENNKKAITEKEEWGEKVWDVGRDTENDICIPFATVSRKHLRIFEAGKKRYLIMDLSSRNGTWIGGRKLPPGRKVECGEKDTIQAGEIGFRLCRNHFGMVLKPVSIKNTNKMIRVLHGILS